MRVIWRNARRVLVLILCLCTLTTLVGCDGSDPAITTEPTKPQVINPANVRVLALNVAYYDGEYTNEHLVDDLTLLPNMDYSNHDMEEDYTFTVRADRLLSLLKHYDPDVFFLNEFNFAWWKEVISDEDAILKTLPKYTYVDSRSTGKSKNGEGSAYKDMYNMVFYDQEQFTLVDTGSFVTCQTWSGWYAPGQSSYIRKAARLRFMRRSTCRRFPPVTCILSGPSRACRLLPPRLRSFTRSQRAHRSSWAATSTPPRLPEAIVLTSIW